MPLAFALAVSVLLHAAAVAMPGWTLPGEAESPQPLEAQLPPLAVPAAAAKPRPVPRPARAGKPAVAPVAAPSAAPAPDAAAAAAEPGAGGAGETAVAEPAALVPEAVPAPELAAIDPQPPALAPPPAPPWPRAGRVRYVVTYGEHGFVIGETIHEWRVDGGRYTLRSGFEPKGIAVLGGRTRMQASAGEVTAAGLLPREFRDQREGRALETAVFDWPAARVVFASGRDGALAAGTQDLLSVFYQLAWLAPRATVEVSVATVNRVGRWTFEWLGEDSVKLATAEVPALHLRTRADNDTTEIWLAPTYGGLPVRIRHVDRDGRVFEQAADTMEFD